MIPHFHPTETVEPLYADFLAELASAGFDGEIRLDYAARLAVATDNSVYQLVPQGVVLPRSKQDVVRLAELAALERYRGVSFVPRGGGTGTNGGSLGPGLCVDLSTRMNRILELDLDAGIVRVQPGVVLDQLNSYLRPHGVFFAPHVATSDRATLGGMISNDSSGKGSRLYGRTSRHVAGLEVVLADATTWRSRLLPADGAGAPATLANAARVVFDAAKSEAERIEATFVEADRFLTGYDLRHAVTDRDEIDLMALLCGSEGTLGFIVEADLRVTPIPPHTILVAATYPSFDGALTDAETILEHQPSAIETIDDTILGLARGDIEWPGVEPYLGDPGAGALHLIELCGDDAEQLGARVAALERTLAATASRVTRVPNDAAAAVWGIRKKGAGLLAALPGERRPVPFVEDCAVPPARLADFVGEFRTILDAHGLRYGIYGHADVGCLHVRPALDLKQSTDADLLRTISDQVFSLVQSHGGVFWGEHGKGLRSEYSPRAIGPELYFQMQRIKQAFDPHNQMNPGKVATPASSEDPLAGIDSPLRGARDREIAPVRRQRFATAIDCNGNGACFSWDADRPMCPSWKATGDRIHSPKGRAALMREWLRRLSLARDASDSENEVDWLGRRWWRSTTRSNDFSREVHAAFDGCLACKACVGECPVHVDIPDFKSEFLRLYHTRYARSFGEWAVAALESALPRAEVAATAINLALGSPTIRALISKTTGLVDLPTLATTSGVDRVAGLSPAHGAGSVGLVPDAFTNYFDPDAFVAMHQLVVACNGTPAVLPYLASGKPLHISGMTDSFETTARETAARIREHLAQVDELICVEPAVALTFRQEYARVSGAGALPIRLPQEWLAERLAGIAGTGGGGDAYVLLSHCTESTTAARSNRLWQDVFALAGLRLEIPRVGCCGMAGAWGHRTRNLETSRAIFESSWSRALRDVPPERVLAAGHSCRTQVSRFAGFKPRHPLETLATAVKSKQ